MNGILYNVLDEVNLLDDVHDGSQLGVRDATCLGEGRETLENGIRKLVAGHFSHDACKVVCADEARGVGVEMLERLADALALKALDKLGKLAATDSQRAAIKTMT